MEFFESLLSDPEFAFSLTVGVFMLVGYLFGEVFRAFDGILNGLGECLGGIGAWFATRAKIAWENHRKPTPEKEAP